MDEVPFFLGDFGDAEARHSERLHVFEGSSGFGELLKLLQRDHIGELATKLNVNNAPLGLVLC